MVVVDEIHRDGRWKLVPLVKDEGLKGFEKKLGSDKVTNTIKKFNQIDFNEHFGKDGEIQRVVMGNALDP